MAVVIESAEMDFGKQGEDLETQELDSPGGIATAQVYGQLLSIYLLQNDTCNAKFLWKRIPQNLKTGELTQIWAVGQKIWQREYNGLYDLLNKDWPEHIKPIMTALTESKREGAYNLVALAYSSIHSDDLASFVGLPVADAVQAAVNRGWSVDSQTNIITPVKIEKASDAPLSSEQQLSVLTDYVSFLEN